LRVVLIILLLAMSPLFLDRGISLLPETPEAKAQREAEAAPIDLSYDVPASLTAGEPIRVASSVVGPGAAYFLHGTLPPGLQLDPEGTISGTPSKAGTFPFRIIVTGGGRRGVADLRLVVRDPLTVKFADELVVEAGAKVEAPVPAITVEGGDGRYSLSVDDAPAWMEVTQDGSVRLVGQAPSDGTYAALVTVEDGEGRKAGGVLPVRIVPPPPPAEPEVAGEPADRVQTPWGVIPRSDLPGTGEVPADGMPHP